MVNKIYLGVLVLFCWISLFINAPANAYEFPPYEGLELKLTGNITESYSNNITYASDRENEVEDFETLLNLGLDFQYRGKRRFMVFAGNVKRELFESQANVRNPSEDARLIFYNEFTKYDRLNLSNTFTHTRVPGKSQGGFDIDQCIENNENQGQPSDEIESICNEFAEQFGRYKGRFDSYSNSSGLTYNKLFSEDFNIRTNYNYRQNWSDDEDAIDADHHSIGLNANYQYSEPTTFSMSYIYRITEYEGRDDISRQSITAGIRQYITKRLYFDGNIGADLAISDSGDDSITGRATITGEIDPRSTAAINYSQGTSISAFTKDTFENWKVTGRLSKYFLEDFNGSLSAFYGKGEYSSTGVEDTLLGASIKLSYNFWRSKRGSNIRGNLGYSYSDLDSTNKNREYTRSSVNSGLTLAF